MKPRNLIAIANEGETSTSLSVEIFEERLDGEN